MFSSTRKNKWTNTGKVASNKKKLDDQEKGKEEEI